MTLQGILLSAMFSPKFRFSPFQDTAVTFSFLGRSPGLRFAPSLSLLQLPNSKRSFQAPCGRNELREHSTVDVLKNTIYPSKFFTTRRRKVVRTFSSAIHDREDSRPAITGEYAKSSQRKIDLQVILVSPQIPGNTGCIARTCAAAAVGLHLVEPLGFEIKSAKLKRAGLDYWPLSPDNALIVFPVKGELFRYVVVKVHSSWAEFLKYFHEQEGDKRLLGFTKKGTEVHTNVKYRPGDWLMFGSETDGIPDAALNECSNHEYGGGTVRIPIDETYVRCLNLSVAAGIGVYEALRQVGFSENMLDTSSRHLGCNRDEPIKEDVFC